ncbi:MAG: T9SS type A sorting domain-containing protein [Chitinophagales bacterium]
MNPQFTLRPLGYLAMPLLMLLLQELPLMGQTYTTKLSNRRSIQSDWAGIGSQNSTRDGLYISHPKMLTNAPAMNPKVIRFPSGGNANWWDWKTGWFVNNPNSPNHKPNEAPEYNTLENFKKLLDATDAVPLFVVNMISSTLAYQLEMLHYADSLGIAIKYIELGNEFYLDEDEDSAYIYSIFPDAQVYGTVASKWIDSIHAHFPECKVAAQGAFNRNNQERRVAWDADLVKTLEGEDAITYHEYYSSSGNEGSSGNGDGKYTVKDIPEFFYRPFKAWNILSSEDLPTVRPGKEVWITEFNMQDFNVPVHGSWGHALFVATQTLHFLESEKITNVNFHTLSGSAGYGSYFTDYIGFKFKSGGSFQQPPNPPTTTPWDLTASGNAIELINETVNGMKYASQLSFEGIPMISILDKDDSVSYPALYGWQFSNNNGSAAVLVNLTANDIKINTADVFKGGGSYTSISADPLDYIANDGDVLRKSATLPTNFTVKAYGIIKITSSYVPDVPPSAFVTAVGSTTFCQGDSVNLMSGSDHYAYLWSTGETTKKIWAKNSGDYWLRVWDKKEGYWASDTLSVTVNPKPEIPTIKNSGNDAFCIGSSTVLTVKNIDANATYKWSTGVTGTSLTIINPGTYTVSVTDQNGCSSVSTGTAITAYPLPQPVITASGPLTFCDGQSVQLDAGADYPTCKWSTDKNGHLLTVTKSGSYNVTVTDINGCTNTSSFVTVVVNPLPSANITTNGPNTFCEGNSPTFLSANSVYPHYQWVKGSKDIDNATSKNYYPLSTGTYKVTVTDVNNCVNQSNGKDITVNTKPKAKVTLTGSKNICNGATRMLSAYVGNGYTYQWIKNEINIPGATQSIYIVSTAGDYLCRVTNLNGCTEDSKVTTFTSDCKEADLASYASDMESAITIYPNPAYNIIHINAVFSTEAPLAHLIISNLLGVVLYSDQQPLNGLQYNNDLKLPDTFTNGTYLLSINNGSQVIFSKFIVAGKR